jgi:geranylgeranyl diphosphate synthase, type I
MDTKIESGAAAATRYFSEKRVPIAEALRSLPSRESGGLSLVPGGGTESLERIAEFCLRGKMIRGCLVFLGAEAADADGDTGLIDCAVAMELFQAGLLAHDDIMDRDETRRGAPTIHARYAVEAEARYAAEALAREEGVASHNPADSLHIGEALGICLGDLCYFEGFASLSRAIVGKPRGPEILGLCSSVLAEVAVAQMSDVRWGGSHAEVREEEILAMYRCKTARYSFSLPLAVGAFAVSGDLAEALMGLGDDLGILFQIRDDELGLYGSAGATGKGVGSDLREGKKTLLRARLLAAAPEGERDLLTRAFSAGERGEGELEADIAYIRRLADELGVARSIDEMKARAEDRARAIIRDLPLPRTETREVFEGLVEWVTRREK